MTDQICKIRGVVKHYAWGGYDFIPQLIGMINIDSKPCAEYWLGAHSSAPSDVQLADGTSIFLDDAIRQLPLKYLGEYAYQTFGELPYLLKVLDVREMLSIQVHPTRNDAKKGFDEEEAAGISITAPHRNYKDCNHKPEVMIALSDFWLLHGFKQEAELKKVLESIPAFKSLEPIFSAGGYKALYKHVMEMPQHEVDKLLLPLVEEVSQNFFGKHEPGFWVKQLYHGHIPGNNLDRGIFSIYFFNIVHISPGEAIFQQAGVPHAYLQGQNIELMANSDNVLRGGLTPKHIDVKELMKHVLFKGVEPEVMRGEMVNTSERRFHCPVDDFGLSMINMLKGEECKGSSFSAEIGLLTKGSVTIDELTFEGGEAFIILPGTTYTIQATADATIFKAFVPAPAKAV